MPSRKAQKAQVRFTRQVSGNNDLVVLSDSQHKACKQVSRLQRVLKNGASSAEKVS